MPITNEQLQDHKFLEEMYLDDYFPDHVVDQGRAILVRLCEQIEFANPADLDELYRLTHAATESFNELQAVFEDNESDIEAVAGECISAEFDQIAKAYGFDNADTEEMLAPRVW